MTINIAKDYTETPGGRYIDEGLYSGEDFRNQLLEPKFIESIMKNERLIINLDGCYGFSTGFLEEAFGGFVRKGYDGETFLASLIFISYDNPKVITEIEKYIKEAIMVEKMTRFGR